VANAGLLMISWGHKGYISRTARQTEIIHTLTILQIWLF